MQREQISSFGEALALRGFPIACCAISVALHGVAVALPLAGTEKLLDFRTEYATFAILCAALAVCGYLVGGAAAYRVLHGTRFCFICIALSIISDANGLAAGILCVTFLFETALAEKPRAALAIDAAAGLVFIAIQVAARGFPSSFAEALVPMSFALVIASVAAFSCLVTAYRESLVERNEEIARLAETVRNLINANQAFQIYANKIQTDSTEKERNRITRELHDSVGYALTNVIVMMNAGKVLLKGNPSALEGLFEKVGIETETALVNTRQILHMLRDIQDLQRIGLQAIVHLAENFRGATGVELDLSFGNLQGSYGRDIDSLLFRFTQEGLTNAFRHGKATRVLISMQQTKSELIATIRDNGSGVPEGVELVEGIGFAGMRERLADYGGTINARNAADGFELKAVIPYGAAG